MTLTELFTDIANAIRSKTGGASKITASDFASEIRNIVINPIMETILWGSNISTNYGNKDLSLTYSGYDYLKLWVGGDTFGARYSKPIILPCNETNKYLVGCVNTGSESANVTITPTKLTYSSSANNYQKITGVVGIKINS